MRKFWLIPFVIAAGAVGAWWIYEATGPRLFREPIRVGVLHSLSGALAISERPLVDAIRMAIREINDQGGIFGRQIEPVVVDGASDSRRFAEEAERLISQERVSVIFGCWTSASRKAVIPVLETSDHLLFYPVQHEGLEHSPNVVYTGAVPNQQIIPAVKWASDHLGQRFFLVGSDGVFPRTANRIIRDQMSALGGQIVGEEYLALGSSDVDAVVRKIIESKPDVILNTINGDSNIAFFRALRAAGVTPDKIASMSFSIAEEELPALGVQSMAGDYVARSYFQSIASDENRKFVSRFQERYGADRVTGDPMEASYLGVHLWKQAVEEAGTDDVRAVREAMANQSLKAPEGIVFVDPDNHHIWRMVRVGRIRADGQVDIVWSSETPVRPVPYPIYRSPSGWRDFLDDLYQEWGGHWAKPVDAQDVPDGGAPVAPTHQ